MLRPMFPLAGEDFPKSSEDLACAIRDALAEFLSLPDRTEIVVVEGGVFPEVDHVKVDLTNAIVTIDAPPPVPMPQGKRTPGITVGRLDVLGQPIRYQDARANFDFSASEVRFDFARDRAGKAILVLADAATGHVDAKIANADLQLLLTAAAKIAAKQQGVTIQDLQVRLTSNGPRTLQAEAHVKAKKMIMTGRILLHGRVEIDGDLEATLSNLSCTGEGVIGTMASGLLQHKLKQLEGQKVPLTTFSLGDVRLHDLSVSTADGLHLTAKFGGG